MTYGIVEKHGGTIGVESILGDGTKFCVSIPIDSSIFAQEHQTDGL
jgi:signal transduction histidine kinase